MVDVAERLWGVVEPYVAAEGVELDDIEVLGSGRLVRVVLDADEALGVDRIADISKGISRLIDADDPVSGAYTLEVTSPGLERKLRLPRHFVKSIGREVRIKTHTPIEGEKVHRGVLTAADDDGCTVDVDGTGRRIAYAEVSAARTVFVWEKGTRPGEKA